MATDKEFFPIGCSNINAALLDSGAPTSGCCGQRRAERPVDESCLTWEREARILFGKFHAGTNTDELGRSGTNWGELGRAWTNWDELEGHRLDTGMKWDELGRARTSWDQQGRTGGAGGAGGNIRMVRARTNWATLGRAETNWDEQERQRLDTGTEWGEQGRVRRSWEQQEVMLAPFWEHFEVQNELKWGPGELLGTLGAQEEAKGMQRRTILDPKVAKGSPMRRLGCVLGSPWACFWAVLGRRGHV